MITFAPAGEKMNMPPYGGQDYATKRAPLTATASKLYQPASQLVALVQRLATRVYELIPKPVAALPKFKKMHQKQPVPPEYVGKRYTVFTECAEATQACADAAALVRRAVAAGEGGAAVLPHVDPESYQELLHSVLESRVSVYE